MAVRQRGGRLVLAAVVVAAMAGGLAGFRTVRADRDPVRHEAVVVPAVTPSGEPPAGSEPAATGSGTGEGPAPAADGPRAEESGVPAGYGRSQVGAQAAAVGWVSSLGVLMQAGPIATADALRSLVSEERAGATIDSLRAERARFSEQFGADPSQAVWIDSPLAVQVEDWNPDRAVVRVWSQLLVGVASEATVQALWRTHTVTVVWEREDWRVDDVSREEGPTPQVMAGDLPSPGGEVAVMAEWTPAVLAGSTVREG